MGLVAASLLAQRGPQKASLDGMWRGEIVMKHMGCARFSGGLGLRGAHESRLRRVRSRLAARSRRAADPPSWHGVDPGGGRVVFGGLSEPGSACRRRPAGALRRGRGEADGERDPRACHAARFFGDAPAAHRRAVAFLRRRAGGAFAAEAGRLERDRGLRAGHARRPAAAGRGAGGDVDGRATSARRRGGVYFLRLHAGAGLRLRRF